MIHWHLRDHLRTNAKVSTGMELGETLQQLFSLHDARGGCFLSFTLRPALRVLSPRSHQKQPGLGARSKCPDRLVTVSAIQTQTGLYSSVPSGACSTMERWLCNHKHTSRRCAQGPSANSIRVILTGTHRRWLQKPRPHCTSYEHNVASL